MLLMMDAESSTYCTEQIQIDKRQANLEKINIHLKLHMLKNSQATQLTINVFAFFFLTLEHGLNVSFINVLFAYASPVSY